MQRITLICCLGSAAIIAAVASQVGSQPAAQGGALMWASPELENPIIMQLDRGRSVHRLREGQDYIVVFPKDGQKVGSTALIGGRNIVIVGGSATVPASDEMKRALYIKDATGTVHVEGLEVTCTKGAEFDAFAISAPEATVQLQNIRACVRGTQNGFHGDLIQPWGGVKELRVGHFTGFSGYQGFQLPAIRSRTVGQVTLAKVDLHSIDEQIPRAEPSGGNGGFLLWTIGGTSCDRTFPISMSEFYAEGRPGRSPGSIVWPASTKPRDCPTTVRDGIVSFPHQPVTGTVTLGKPAKGEFVPLGVAGVDYKRGA
jgi:hypothetical protein